jgi:glutamate synthase (NADPH/NADH) large chain
MAFVYDADGLFESHVNPDSVIWQRLDTAHWQQTLHRLIEEHHAETGSAFAEQLLSNWDREQGQFWQVVPKEMLERLPHPLTAARAA